jgi:hypothetical protein
VRSPELRVRGNLSKNGPTEKTSPKALEKDIKSAASVNVNDSALQGVLWPKPLTVNIDVDFFGTSIILFHHEVFDLGSS